MSRRVVLCDREEQAWTKARYTVTRGLVAGTCLRVLLREPVLHTGYSYFALKHYLVEGTTFLSPATSLTN